MVQLLQGELEKCLNYLKRISEDPVRIKTFRQVRGDLFEVYAREFEPLRTDARYKDDFEKLLGLLQAG